MTDYWPHLNNLERGRLLAEVLGDDVKGSHIVDLNCGKAPVFAHIDGYASYYGNDLQPDFIEALEESRKTHKKKDKIPEAVFQMCADKDVSREKIDVLMLLGACGDILHPEGHPAESDSDSDVLLYLTNLHHPKVVLLEVAYEVYERMDKANVEGDFKRMGYQLDKWGDVSLGAGRYNRRIYWKFRLHTH